MNKFINNKILMVGIIAIFAFVSAQNSISINFLSKVKVEDVGEGSSFLSDLDGGGNLDAFEITFKGVIENVTAELKLDTMEIVLPDFDLTEPFQPRVRYNNVYDRAVSFKSLSVTVADLFDGVLTLQFLDIGYGAGYNQAIRPDIDSKGLKFTVKPIEMLSIGLGYGIGVRDFRSSAPYLAFNNVNVNYYNVYLNRRYHAIQFDLGITNDYVPVIIYAGAIIIDGGIRNAIKQPTENGDLKDVKVFHSSIGFSADLLATVKTGALNLDLGVVLPLSGAATSRTHENELNLAAILHGSVLDLGVAGIGLEYALAFALDTDSKTLALGDIDWGIDSDSFMEMIRVSITPSYTIGQFKFAYNGVFGMVGEKTALFENRFTVFSIQPIESAPAYYKYEVTPSITWSSGPGNSVKAYFTYGVPNLDKTDVITQVLGLDVNVTIGVEGL